MPSFRLSLLFIMLLFFTAAGVLRAQVPPADEIKPTSLLELNTTTEAGQWVSVDAFIWIWRYTAPRLELRLNTRDSWGTAFITLDDPAQLPKGLHGAKVRLTGQATGKRNRYNGLLVPSLQQMEVLQPGTDDPFLPDVVPLEAVARHQIEWGRRVTVRGTLCTFANPADLLISHGGVGLHCVLTMGWTPGFGRSDIAGGTTVIPEMSPGDEVEITGSLVESEQGNKVLAELTYCHVRVIGKGTAPQPRPVPISHLAKFKEYSEWVSVEGIVNAWVWDGVNLTLGLLDPHSASVKQTVLNAASMPFPEDLFGARVRLTGMTRAMLPEAEYNLCVPSPQYFEVLQPGAKDAFDAPEHPLADVARRTVPPADRVRLRGVLLARPLPDVLHIRHQDTAICAKLDRPWNRSSAPATRFAGIGPWPENLAIGDEVEIVGHPLPEVEDATRQLYDFDSAIVRVIKSGGTPPAPRQSALDDIISGSFTADLVETRGRLVSIDQMPAGQVYWRTSLQLESAAGVLLPAVSYSQKPPSTKTLRVDDEVLLRGLVSRATSQTPRQLWFSSAAEDVKSLGVSPVVFTRQLWRWGGGGVAVLLLLGGWITLLRRTNRLQSQNATFLEQKVEERTTEL
ncbi:MAG: hypothetical protein JNG86_04065, partial [Verrucomicrobiaceae bacterium]|nr:hypothetical protein [Verrucomicrobiaceae bacterium]